MAMSETAEPPAGAPEPDAWATACEEDLAAERERRREQFGPQPVSAAEELRRLADAVASRVAELGRPLAGPVGSAAAQGVAQQFLAQARAVVEPVIERNPRVFDHLAAAGGELLAAYRSAVQGQERRWTASAGAAGTEAPADAGTAAPPGGEGSSPGPDGGHGRKDDGGTASGPERIDLD
jgi:hypothetical protein